MHRLDEEVQKAKAGLEGPRLRPKAMLVRPERARG